MAMKKTQLERLNAARLQDRLRKSAPPDRYAQGAHTLVAELLERGLGT